MIPIKVEKGSMYLINEYSTILREFVNVGKVGDISELGLNHLESIFGQGGGVTYILLHKGFSDNKFYKVYKDNVTNQYVYQNIRKK